MTALPRLTHIYAQQSWRGGADQLPLPQVLERLPAGAYTCDAEGLITYYNQHALQLWGRAPRLHDAADRFCGSFRLYGADGASIAHDECWMALALKQQREYHGCEIVIERPDGQRVWALAHANPIFDDDKRLLGAVNVLVDITAQKLAAEERRRFEAQMLHAQKLESLGVLAGGIAHDFNNLLTAMMGYASLASMELDSESTAAAMLREINTAANRAAELARQMLAYAGGGVLLTKSFDLAALVGDMSRLLDTVVSKKALVQLCLEPVTIEGDPSQIGQVVMNLITNASEALEGQNGLITVRAGSMEVDAQRLRESIFPGALTPGRYACIEVSDTGCGMTPATLARIFEPFFSTKFTGRGLGLAAVLGIVKSHHGTICVNSAPGEGTTCLVILPRAEAAPAAVAAGPPASAQPAARGTILVVDDDAAVRALVGRVLVRAGFQMREAGDGQAGLRAFAQHQHELAAVLLDLTMPQLDGLEVLQELRRLKATVPVLLMSGYSRHDVAARTADLAVDGFIEKPFQLGDLLAELRRVLPLP